MAFSTQCYREWRILLSDSWLKAMVFWLPVVLFFSMWLIFSAGIARDLPIGVVDLDHSRLSRGLVRYYDASPTLAVTNVYTSATEGSHALKNADIYALIVLPAQLEKDTLLGRAPEVTAFYNSQYILVGKLINSAMVQAQGTYTAGIDTLENMANGSPVPLQALGQAVPIQSQITPLFNSNSHYGQFLVSAAIPAIWQILIVATTVLAMSAEFRQKGISAWLANSPINHVIAKLLPYTLLFWLQGFIFLWAMYGVLEWPMHGSWFILSLSQLLMVVACQSMGAAFFLLTLDSTRAISLVAGFTAPAFAFMGVTFPATDMPFLAQLWRAMLPVSHYIEIQIQQVDYGASLADAIPNMIALACFGFVLLVAMMKAKKIATVSNSAVNAVTKNAVSKYSDNKGTQA
ncbi:ABC transporter permease [Photobacterium frigidiphilum]|uniref:ABC transporter permease n=1 Tax=Photobacterium frigidiphilum TaxID=264736 RepID=UPI003D0D303A